VNEQPPKPRRGCLFYGCLSGLALLVLMLGALLLGIHYTKKLLNRYTDTKPMELPTVQMSQADVDKLNRRVEAFQKAIREEHAAEPLVLTSDDINALIANGPEREALKGKFYLSFDNDQLKGQVSLPLNEVGLTMLKGRYLNGSATFDVAFRNGAVSVTPRTILVKGNPLPEKFMKELRNENLAADLTNDPDAKAVLKGLQDIQIKEDKLVLVPKEQP
jgi:hypothetical protein